MPCGMLGMALVRALALSCVMLLALPGVAWAQAAPPSGHKEEAFDFMNLLANAGLHDIKHEAWNAYGQFTYISSWKLRFDAPYTNLNGSPSSLTPDPERSFTGSFTMFFGAKLWPGAEAYLVPEVIASRPLSRLHGLGGSIQNFELQKTGSETPQIYRSRAFLRQTIKLGGESVEKTSDPMQLGSETTSRRIVLTGGNFTTLDVMDRNGVTGDPRRTFYNIAFMTHSSFDFASDARGYSWGLAGELYWDDWAFRMARMAVPANPNELALDFHIDKYYGDQFELEHDHEIKGQPGAVRVLAYRNRLVTGNFDEAIAAIVADPSKNAANCPGYNYGSTNTTAPDLCWVRRPQTKVGIGINLEQNITDDLGLFFRGMISDGRTEVYAYTSSDRSLSFGATARGTPWKRPFDQAGVGFALAWISSSHADYLARGGIDGFIGDGALTRGTESVLDLFYSFNVLDAIWLSADYQHIVNPAFNSARGPVNVIGTRVHAEF